MAVVEDVRLVEVRGVHVLAWGELAIRWCMQALVCDGCEAALHLQSWRYGTCCAEFDSSDIVARAAVTTPSALHNALATIDMLELLIDRMLYVTTSCTVCLCVCSSPTPTIRLTQCCQTCTRSQHAVC